MNDTRAKLLAAAATALREDGAAATSARVIAGRAGVNQALIFYHFGTVSELLEAACRQSVDVAVGHYRAQLAAVSTLADLVQVGRELHTRERANGNVAMMAQLMSAAGYDPVLARAARYAMGVWSTEIESVVTRILHGGPLTDIADDAGLARALSASFIGIELYEGADADGAESALVALERLGALVEMVNDLGPVGRRALRAKLKGLPPRGVGLSAKV